MDQWVVCDIIIMHTFFKRAVIFPGFIIFLVEFIADMGNSVHQNFCLIF